MTNRQSLLLLAQFLALQLAAQTEFRTELLDIRDGLSQNFISALAQDREGFLWAGTKNGLNRYDGRQFKVWTNDPENLNSLSNDWVWVIEPHEDFLLLGTNGGGLDFFDRRHERFFHLPKKENFPGSVVKRLQLDAEKRHIWAVANSKSDTLCLFRLALPDRFWEKLSAGDAAVLQKIESQKLLEPSTGDLDLSPDGTTAWACSGLFLHQFDFKTGASLRQIPSHHNFMGAENVGTVDADGFYWAFAFDSVYCFDGTKWTFFRPDHIEPRCYMLDWENRLLVFSGGEIRAFDIHKIAGTGTLTRAQADWVCPAVGDPSGGLRDRSGIYWLGTTGGGIQKLDPRQQAFRHFFPGKSIYSAPFEDSDGTKGFWEYGTGFHFSEKNASGTVARFARSEPRPFAHVQTVRDNGGYFWLISQTWEQFEYVKISPDGSAKRFPFESLGKQRGNFFMDKSGKIWLAACGWLLRFDPSTEQFQKFDYRPALPIEHEVYALAETSGGTIWLGTSQGLVKCQPTGSNFQFSLLKNEPGNPNSLRKNPVAALLTDPADESVLWLGTKGGGLTRLETQTGKMRHLTARNGLPDEVIYGVLPDGKGNLWLSSNKGIIRYNPTTGEIRNFTEADGAQGDEFNTWAYAKIASGKLLFGGLNGLNELDPADFSENPNLPPVFLTGLKINNRAVEPHDSTGVLAQNLPFLGQIEVPFSQNSLTLNFSALEFTASGKNRFRYFLEGAEREWAHETTENSATYLNLSPGTYTFKVMASNGDGLWNPQPATLKIAVRPPWWRSWWAYLIYMGMAVAAARWLHRVQLKRRLEHAENERLKELDSFKSRFYANITHEFRTPLTVILGNVDLLEKESSPSKLEPVRRNARNLLALVNQMLDLSKVENQALQLNLRQADIVAHLKYVVESFQSFANSKNQALRFSSDFAQFDMDFDAERLNQVLSNLISNALKFTPSGGQVLVKAQTDATQKLEITVEDTGTGISPADLPHIFDRFFQAKDGAMVGGSGIGLALTKELVKLFGGEITAESQVGRGTKFTVKLPVSRNAERAERLDLSTFQTLANLEIAPSSAELPLPRSLESSKPRILVIEDNPDVVAYLKAILSQKFQISVAFNGRIGLEMAFAETPDLVLSDLMMPEKDGLEVCQTLKNDPRTSHLPIVLLTAKAAVEDRVAGISRGADAYLAKPFHETELFATLENLLAAQRRLQTHFSKMAQNASPEFFPENSALPNPESAPEEQFLKNLRTFILEKMADSTLSLDDLCRAAGMGKSSLHAKLTALTGLPPMMFLRHLRLARARDLLLAGGKNVSEVAFEVGFDDPKYFSRAFSEHFGFPPSKV